MEYQISDLSQYSPEKGVHYFFDANIWINYLYRSDIVNPKKKRDIKIKQYNDFFDKVISFVDTPKPKIIVTNMLISEIVNRFLKSYDMEKYIRKNQALLARQNHIRIVHTNSSKEKRIPKEGFYKSVYRKTDNYNNDYVRRINEIKAFIGKLVFASDGSNILAPRDIFSSKYPNLDFNDQIFFQFAKKYNYTFVTDDGDYWVKDIKVLTLNQSLLEKQTEYNSERKDKSEKQR